MLRSLLLLAASIASFTTWAVQVAVSHNDAHCGLNNGSATASASGGLPPYSYSWDTGATTAGINGLAAGSYVVTVTDGLGNTAQGTAVINMVNSLNVSQSNGRPDCMNGCSGIALISFASGGTAPYTYACDPPAFPPVTDTYGMSFHGMCGGQQYTMSITDANGCMGTMDLYMGSIDPWMHEVGNITPACGTQANGTITMLEGGNGFGFDQYWVSGASGFFQIYDVTGLPFVITGLPADTYSIQPIITTFQTGGYCMMGPTGVVVPALAEPCGSVSGTVFHDADQDCAYNGFDQLIPYRVLTVQPGPTYAMTNSQGAYYSALPFNNFTLAQPLYNEVQLCPPTSPVALTVDAFTPNVVIDLADSSTVPHDISVHPHSAVARPGFPTWVQVGVRNNSAYPSGAVTLSLTYDPLLLNPAPVNPQWAIPVIAPYDEVYHTFYADVPADINLLGTVLTYTVVAANTANEPNTANNSASLNVTISGSFDPNDKQGTTSSGLSASQYFLDQDEWIDYTIRFQNTGTAAATDVVLRDTLDAGLDIPSLEILGASHPFEPSFGVGRELNVTFAGINLPDSATDFAGSQGYISYRIKPRADVVLGTVLENTAAIYFDLNPPIITNTVAHVVDMSTGVAAGNAANTLVLSPNPTTERLNVALKDPAERVLGVFTASGARIAVPVERHANGVVLDVSGLPKGIYAVRTTTASARFVKL